MPNAEKSDLEGTTAVVTGGSRGIGAAIARQLGDRGARVAVNYRNSQKAAESVVSGIRDSVGTAFAYGANVADDEEARDLIHTTREKYGSLDLLVNNAGVCRPAPVEELDSDQLDEVFDTNLKGAFYATQPAVEIMKDQGSGTIINLSSIAGQIGTVDAAYAASKAGLLGFTKSLAREVGPYGIRVNAVAPGPVETDMGGEIYEYLEETEFHGHENLDTFLDAYSATPEHIAEGVVYLAESDFVTGETLTINGGMHME